MIAETALLNVLAWNPCTIFGCHDEGISDTFSRTPQVTSVCSFHAMAGVSCDFSNSAAAVLTADHFPSAPMRWVAISEEPSERATSSVPSSFGIKPVTRQLVRILTLPSDKIISLRIAINLGRLMPILGGFLGITLIDPSGMCIATPALETDTVFTVSIRPAFSRAL